MLKRGILIFAFTFLIIAFSVIAGDLFSLQGNVEDSSGTKLSSGGVVVEIWDGPDVAGSNLIYNSTDNFTGSGNISDGKFDIVLGDALDKEMLNLEYGKVYYMDIYVEGEDMNFSGKERQIFMSSVGTINSTFLNTSNDYMFNSLLIDNSTIAVNNFYLNISDGVSPWFLVSPDGKVGVGTAAPSKTLEVVGAAAVGVLNATALTVAGLTYFMSNVSMADNLTVGNAMYVDSSAGNVGIGTASPGTLLETVGGDVNITNGSDVGLYFNSSENKVGIGTAAPSSLLDIKGAGQTVLEIDGGSVTAEISLRESGTEKWRTGYDMANNIFFIRDQANGRSVLTIGDSADADSIDIQADGDVVMMGGNVGIGDSAPDAHLEVSADGGSGGNIFLLSSNDNLDGDLLTVTEAGRFGIGSTTPTSLLHLNVSDGNVASVTDVLTLEHVNSTGEAADGIGSGILFRSIDDGMDVENISMIAGVMEDISNASERGALVFYTGYGDENGQITNLSSSERMRITGTGNVGIGTTAPGALLEITNTTADVVLFNVSNGDDMIVVNGTGVDFDSSTLYVDKVNNRIGIGTTTPAYTLDIKGPNTDYAVYITQTTVNRHGLGVVSSGGDGAGVAASGATAISATTNSNSGTAYYAKINTNLVGGRLFYGLDGGAGTNTLPLFEIYNGGEVTIGSDVIRLNMEPAGAGTFTGNFLNFLNNDATLFMIKNDSSVSIGTGSPTALLHIENASAAVDNAYLNISDGVDAKFIIYPDGNVVIGGADPAANDTMFLTIGGGGDLNVSGSIYYGGSQLTGSPFVVESVEGEPIPICMKNSEGNWVGCMPDNNNNWRCAPNSECDEKVLRIKTTNKLRSEGADDNEIGHKLESLRQKFKQGKTLKDIKDEIREEIGDMNVLNELSDKQPSFGIQTSSSEVNALITEMNSLKSENELLKQRLSAVEELLNSQSIAEPTLIEEPQLPEAPTSEELPAEEMPLVEQPAEQPVEESSPAEPEPTQEEHQAEELGFSITGASIWQWLNGLVR